MNELNIKRYVIKKTSTNLENKDNINLMGPSI